MPSDGLMLFMIPATSLSISNEIPRKPLASSRFYKDMLHFIMDILQLPDFHYYI